jgi:nitrite reductase (NO-forming)
MNGSQRPTDPLLASLAAGVALLVAAAGTLVVGETAGWDRAIWAALHLALLGGVSQLVIGVSQFFVTAFLATSPPSGRVTLGEIASWSVGSIAVAVGVAAGSDPLVIAGAAVLLATLALYLVVLRKLARGSLQKAPWASRWYRACTAWLVAGIVAGVMLATGVAWSHGYLLGAHLAFNLGGWLGGAIVGTLHTFFPSLTRTQLRFPRLQPVTFLLWNLGVAGLALGYGFGQGDVAVAGWALLLGAACTLTVNLVASAARAPRGLPLSARLVAWAQPFLPVGIAFALVAALDHPLTPMVGADRAVLAVLVVAGWIGLTVAGSILHLVSIVVRVRDFSRPVPTPNPVRDSALVAVAVGGISLLALAQVTSVSFLRWPATSLLLLAALALAATALRSVVLAFRLGAGGRLG